MSEVIMFGAGCFWGIEATFMKTKGVIETSVGYSGGTTQSPTYEQVCSKTTGHAEVVLVKYDPKAISFSELLDVFWQCHDATQLNRQGWDIGTQYRSAIFYTTEEQKDIAQKSKSELIKQGMPVVTEITKVQKFWPAEEYHQKYFEKKGGGSCHI